MPLLKIWDVKRLQKKCIAVSEAELTIDHVKEKANSKLNMITDTLVLEEDGTEIDDNDVLKEVVSYTFLALRAGEIWSKSEDLLPVSHPMTMSSNVTFDKPDIEVNPEPCTSQCHDDPADSGLPTGLPKPDNVPLPVLSPALHIAIETGQKESYIFNRIVKECEIFYITKYPNMADTSYYQSIGRRMVAKYPNLAYAEGKTAWSFFVSKLSQRIRTYRFQRNAKSRRPADHTSSSTLPRKLFRMTPKSKPVRQEVTSSDFEAHVLEIQKEWEGKRSMQHIRTLLQQTRRQRHDWQTTLSAGKIGPILERFPCFEEGSFLLHEFFAGKNVENPDQFRNQITENMEWVIGIVASKKTELEGTEAEQSIQLLYDLEKFVAKQKGKGTKSKTCIKVVKDVQSVDKLPVKALDSEDVEAPRLVVFLDTEKNVLCQYIIGDGVQIFAQATSILDAMMVLMATYYVLDLEYPTVYCQVLGFIQQWVLSETYTGSKTSNWIKFSDELSRTQK